MAFLWAVPAGAAVYKIGHGDYSDHSRHSRYHEYGDSALREQIRRKETDISRKESDVETARRHMNDNFNSRVNELKRERNYSGLNCLPDAMIHEVKDDMRRELDAELKRERDELAAIDNMIAKINELALQTR